MKKVHIRQIFRINIPINCPPDHEVVLVDKSDDFGFTLKDCNSERRHHYQLELFCIEDIGLPARTISDWATIAKRNPISCNTGEDAIVRLKVNHGVFDFRKQPEQLARVTLNYFVDGVFVQRGFSPVFKILPKKRQGFSYDECTVRVFWDNNNVNANGSGSGSEESYQDQTEEMRTQPTEYPPQYSNNTNQSHYSSESYVSESQQPSPDYYFKHEPVSERHDYPQHHMPLLLAPLGGFDHVPESPIILPQNEQYMVLYNGNAEVIGNFRALNFYKSSDINIKEDIRLLVEDHDCRDTLLQIDGVNYKFKKGVHADTNRRFVGYIAQQVESVVPEAVQLIDGILHVDYESLLPYLSESVRANYNDIKNLKSNTDRIQQALDSMYEQFIKKEGKDKPSKEPIKTTYHSHKTSHGRSRMLQIVFGLVISALLIGVGVAVFVWPNVANSRNNQNTPQTAPTEPSTSTAIPLSNVDPKHMLILKELYRDTNGANWTRSDNWLTDAPLKDWFGVTVNGFSDQVSALSLPNNNLDGTIPESFDQLRTIEALDLHGNRIMGTLPTFEGWYMLRHLDLSRNIFLSEMPETLVNRGSIQTFNVSYNQLYGKLPDQMSLRSVKVFDLSHNMFEGTLPIHGMMFMPVEVLALNNNFFNGQIRALPYHIEILSLHHNGFFGDLALSNLDYLKALRLSYTSFSGDLKLTAKQFAQLEELTIVGTLFDSIDVENATLSNNVVCDASGVHFSCPLPDWAVIKCNATCGN